MAEVLGGESEELAAEAGRVSAAWGALSEGALEEICGSYSGGELRSSAEGLRSVMTSGRPEAVAEAARGVVAAWEGLWDDDRDAISSDYTELAAAVVGLQWVVNPNAEREALMLLG